MKKLVLHIGMHKTGTTSLQRVLGDSQDILRESNIYFARTNEFDKPNSFYVSFLDNPTNHISFKNREIYDADEAKVEQDYLLGLWRERFESFEGDYFLISDEELSYLSKNEVSKMADFLSDYFNNITIIMYVREPGSFIPSIINEHVKYGVTEIDTKNFSKISYYKSRLKKYIEVFGEENIIIRPFNKSYFKNGDLFDDFFHSLGIDFDVSTLKNIVVNESLGQNSVTFLLEYNKKFPRFINGEINKERGLAFRVNIFFQLLQKINDKKFMLDLKFSNREANRINEEIAYINQFLSDEEKFSTVEASDNEVELPDPSDIPLDFFLELINEYNKKVDTLIDKNAELMRINKRKDEQIKRLKK